MTTKPLDPAADMQRFEANGVFLRDRTAYRNGPFDWPHGKRFAFAIIDDTDVATVENVEPVYRLLEELGLRATKTVWPVACPEGSANFSSSQTLDDADYLAFVLDLQRRGFEIAFHNATMETSTRERTERALQRFRELFGQYPRVHANHSYNRENLYWGEERVDNPLVRWVYSRVNSVPKGFYQGHKEHSEYWWGDLCRQRIEYVRNLTFNSLNLAAINPSMPYRDPKRPLVRWWYSAADADNVEEFNRIMSSDNQAALEASGGFCILATHFGKGYVRHGEVDPQARQLLRELAGRNGWFCNVSELLDWLRGQRVDETLPAREWRRMQWLWLRDLFVRRLPALSRLKLNLNKMRAPKT